jgi:hypothetical protein
MNSFLKTTNNISKACLVGLIRKSQSQDGERNIERFA